MPIIFRSYFGLQQADFRPMICRSYFDLISGYSRPILDRSHFELISGYSRPILGRSYFDLISGYSRPMLFWVTAGRSYFRTRRNACVTAGKTTMTAGKIYLGCFEMLSWPHLTSASIINTCFWLLETSTKCSYFIEENIRPGAQRLAFEVKYEYIVRRPRIYRGPAACTWASFQTTGAWCVSVFNRSEWWWKSKLKILVGWIYIKFFSSCLT